MNFDLKWISDTDWKIIYKDDDNYYECYKPYEIVAVLNRQAEMIHKLNDENEQLKFQLDNLKSSSAKNQKVVQSNDDDFIKEVDGKLFFRI